MLSEADADICERSRLRQLYRHTLMTDFAQALHNNISDAIQWDRSAVSQVMS